MQPNRPYPARYRLTIAGPEPEVDRVCEKNQKMHLCTPLVWSNSPPATKTSPIHHVRRRLSVFGRVWLYVLYTMCWLFFRYSIGRVLVVAARAAVPCKVHCLSKCVVRIRQARTDLLPPRRRSKGRVGMGCDGRGLIRP